MKKSYFILLNLFCISVYSLNLNPESRIMNLGDRVSNLDPESKANTVIDNHPKAVTAACAVYAKGACVAVKLAKHGASELSSDNKPNKLESTSAKENMHIESL